MPPVAPYNSPPIGPITTRQRFHPTKTTQNDAVKEDAKHRFRGLYEKSRGKPYPLELRDQRLVYRRLVDHLDDIERKRCNWREYAERAASLFIFSGLVAALVCSLMVEPTNRQRILKLRIWQWVTMAIMIFSVFSLVPAVTFLVSWPFRFFGRTHKHRVYFLRRLKRSVDVTLWSGLVLFGWYVWFRPRLKHVYKEVSVIACQQVTRLLMALSIGAVLWTLKDALYLKLKADLHYDQLFDRISETVAQMNGYEILERGRDDRADFLAYDEKTMDDFSAYEKEEDRVKKMGLLMRYMMRRNWKLWFGRSTAEKEGEVRKNIWMDVTKMRRESVPIWILVRLSEEYLDRVKVLRKGIRNVDELINDDHQLLELAKQMFKNITGSTKQDIDQFDEIEEAHLGKYLSRKEIDYLFKLLKLHQVGEENNTSTTANANPTEEIINTKQHAEPSSSTPQENKTEREIQNQTLNRAIPVDKFLDWAVRLHKNCWGLERTLKSSYIAFVKLNRMLDAFLFVLIVIIWLLLSKIVNTGQLALLFAPFLAASFMFENTSKNMFHGIIFAFAMHPFDVGDRVIIEDIQMRVKELHILTSVFYKYDTGAEVIFPNSMLAKTKIVNLDITPDQSDTLEFIIRSPALNPTPPDKEPDPPTPLENIKDLELKIQLMLDNDIYYASDTKVVKNAQDPLKPVTELKMTVHFKYLVSYLTAEKKAEQRSKIYGKIMRFLREMKMNMQEYPIDYKPYVIELTTEKKKKAKLNDIESLKRHILARLDVMKYYCCKVVLTSLKGENIVMSVYVGESDKKLTLEDLKSDNITEELKRGTFFAENVLRDYGYTLKKVGRGEDTLHPGKWQKIAQNIEILSPRGGRRSAAEFVTASSRFKGAGE